MRKMRKGFTLVELLIVTVKDQTPKAQAAKIISDFKLLRTAVALYNIDSSDTTPTDTYFNSTASPDYLNGGKLGKFTVQKGANGVWTATYNDTLSTAAVTQFNDQAAGMGMTANDSGVADVVVYRAQ